MALVQNIKTKLITAALLTLFLFGMLYLKSSTWLKTGCYSFHVLRYEACFLRVMHQAIVPLVPLVLPIRAKLHEGL